MKNLWEVWFVKFIRVFCFILVLFLIINTVVYYKRGDNIIIPLTNSISFNTKIYEMRNINKNQFDYIAVGSSMTLNNLNSEVLNNYLSKYHQSFYNFSSWGMQMNVIDHFSKELVEIYKPKGIIIFSNIGDFTLKGPEDMDYEDLKKYLHNQKGDIIDFYLFLKYRTFKKDHFQEYLNHKERINDYDSLSYDNSGGVSLNVFGEHILSQRWNERLETDFSTNPQAYESLEELSEFCSKKNIKLYFIQTPYRKSWVDDLGQRKLDEHFLICKSIIEKYGNIYYNSTEKFIYPDDVFVDVTHLHFDGAKILTKRFIEECLRKDY